MAKQALGTLDPPASEEAATEAVKPDGEPAPTEETPPSMPSSND